MYNPNEDDNTQGQRLWYFFTAPLLEVFANFWRFCLNNRYARAMLIFGLGKEQVVRWVRIWVESDTKELMPRRAPGRESSARPALPKKRLRRFLLTNFLVAYNLSMAIMLAGGLAPIYGRPLTGRVRLVVAVYLILMVLIAEPYYRWLRRKRKEVLGE